MAGPGGRTVGRANIRISPNTGRFRGDLQKDLERLERSLTVQIPTRLDTRRLATEATRVKADLERRLGSVDVDLGVSGAQQANAQISAVARDRTANVRVDVDRSAIARARAAVDQLTGALGSLGRAGGGAVGVVSIVGAFSAVAAGAAAALVPVVQLATALAPAVGILAVLPGMAFAAGASVAVLATAFAGVGEALGAAVSGDAAALAEALEDLAPAAANVVREVAALAPQFSALRESVQGSLFGPLQGHVQALGENLLPVLSAGMVRVAESMGLAAANTARFLASGQSLTFLDALFASTATSISNATGTLPNFLSGLMALGTVALPFVEAMGTGLARISQRFRDWAIEAAITGEAHGWIEGAIEVFRQLGSILGNIGDIFASVGRAAGDGGLLTTLDDLTGSLAEFLRTGEGIAALEGFFEGLSSVGAALSPVLASILSAIGALSPAIGRIAEAFGPVLTSAIDALLPGLLALEPGIVAVLDALGDGIGALADSGALELLGEALSSILTAVTPMLPILGELAGILIGALAEALLAVGPSLQLLAETFADELAPYLPQMAEAFTALVDAIVPLIPPLIEMLIPSLDAVAPLMELLVTTALAFAQALTDLQPAILMVIQFFTALFVANAQLMSGLYQAAAVVVNFAASVSQTIRNLVGAVISRFTSMRDRAVNAVSGLVSGAIGLVTGLWRRGVAIVNSFRDGIWRAFSTAKTRGISLMAQLRDGAVAWINRLVSTVTGLPNRIVRVFRGAGRWLRTAGRNVITGLINGITSKLGDLYDRMSNIANNVREYWPFSPAKRGPLRTHPMDQAGRNVAAMLAEGMAQGQSLVDRAASGLAGAAAAGVNLTVPSPADGAAQRGEDLSAALAAMAAQPVVVAVDGQEIARATRSGERQLARR